MEKQRWEESGRRNGEMRRRAEESKSRLAKAARSTFRSQNVQSTSASEHFWKLRCRKVRACCAKHVSKSKCTKHIILGPLLDVEMSKKCAPLCRKHISKSKCTKHFSFGALLEVEMSKKSTRLWCEGHFEVKSVKC